MATLRKGSTGQDVRELQTALNGKGYTLSVDGIYGDKTAAAVRDYQQKNGLSMVDGIAGNETWGSLRAATQSSTPAQTTNNQQYGYDASGNKAYQDALKRLQEMEGTKPSYDATYDKQLSDLYEKIMNREKFSYDAANDPLYQQYREMYTREGKAAMQDTMGQAAALTGGYGSTYAQSVGQQQYDAYLQKLNEVVPELYSQAREAYNDEGDRMMQQYQMVGDLRSDEYSKYRDALSDWWQGLNYQTDRADSAYNQGFNEWSSEYQNRYQAERDRISDEQWQKQFDEAKREYEQTYALQQQAARSSSSGGSSSSRSSDRSSKRYDSHGYSAEQIKALQRAAGITADGIWGAQTQAAYEAGYRPDSGGDLSGYTLVNKNGSGWIALQNKDGRTGGRYSEEEIQRMIARGKVEEIVDHNKKTVTYRKK